MNTVKRKCEVNDIQGVSPPGLSRLDKTVPGFAMPSGIALQPGLFSVSPPGLGSEGLLVKNFLLVNFVALSPLINEI